MQEKKITVHQILWYILLFSVLGLLLETLYCYTTTGVLESRKGLLIGPVCPIYGVGASILIIVLNRYQGNSKKIFFYGMLIGSIFEYLMSYAMEAIYGTRFWEYSYMRFHINGRISTIYSLFWGILSLLLMKYIKPKIDSCINKIPKKHILEPIIVSLFILDNLITIWAITTITKRAQGVYYEISNTVSSNTAIHWIEETVFSNKIVLNTFPNLRFVDKEGKEVFIKNVLSK